MKFKEFIGKAMVFAFVFVAFFSSLVVLRTPASAHEETILFSDNFDDGVINSSKWLVSGDGITEDNGALYIFRNAADDAIRTIDSFSGSFQVELGIRLDQISWQDMFHGISLWDSEGNGISFGFCQYGNFYQAIHSDGSIGFYYESSFQSNKWYHWKLLIEGEEIYIYVDGKPEFASSMSHVKGDIFISLPGFYKDGNGGVGTKSCTDYLTVTATELPGPIENEKPLPPTIDNPLIGPPHYTTIDDPLLVKAHHRTITGTVTSGEVGGTIKVYFNGVHKSEYDLVTTTTGWSRIVTLPTGQTTKIEFTLTNKAGNESVKSLYGYMLADSSAPTVTITAPGAAISTDAASIILEATVTKDTWEEFSELMVRIDATSLTAPITATNMLSADGKLTRAVELIDGTNTISVSAQDMAGNWSTVKTVAVTRTRLTSLKISDENFALQAGKSKYLTATLTSDGSPVANKLITWSATAGTIVPSSSMTDAAGQVSAVYTAPSYETYVIVSASYAGSEQYERSSVTSFGMITVPPTGISTGLIIGIAIIIGCAVIIVALYMRRRKPTEPWW